MSVFQFGRGSQIKREATISEVVGERAEGRAILNATWKRVSGVSRNDQERQWDGSAVDVMYVILPALRSRRGSGGRTPQTLTATAVAKRKVVRRRGTAWN